MELFGACSVNGSSVCSVYELCCHFVVDCRFGDFFVLFGERQLWTVESLGGAKSLLLFGSLELVKIG
jgi:hypothetical protein